MFIEKLDFWLEEIVWKKNRSFSSTHELRVHGINISYNVYNDKNLEMKNVNRGSGFSSISRKFPKLFPSLYRNDLVIGLTNEDYLPTCQGCSYAKGQC